MNSFISDSIWHLLFRIFSVLISVLTTLIISNALGAESKGNFSLFFLIIGYFIMVGSIGLPGSTVYFSARNTNFNPWYSISLSYLLSVIICILYFISNYLFFDDQFANLFYIILGVVYIFISNVNNVKQHLLISKKE